MRSNKKPPGVTGNSLVRDVELFRQHRFAVIKLVAGLHADQINAGGLAIGVPTEVVDSGFAVAKLKALHHLATGVVDPDAHILS